MARLNLTGQVLGYLTVIEFSHTHRAPSGHTVNYWKCLCKCGTERIASVGDLRSKSVKVLSCGCYQINRLRDYNLSNKKEKSVSWTGVGEISGAYFCSLQANAKSKKREFAITKEYIWNLFLKQERKCALSGEELCFSSQQRLRDGTASLDRINSSIGYVEGNLQWIHKDINNMKQDYDEKYFIEVCEKILKHKKEQDDKSKIIDS